MISHNYSSEGIVLAKRKHQEADRILTIYSKNFGKLSLLAKGVRKPKSRKRGHLEVFSIVKFSAVKLSGMDLISEVETLQTLDRIKKDLKKIALAFYFVEVIAKVTHDSEKNTEIYDLLINYLTRLEKESKLKTLRKEFLEELLVILGYWPEDKKIVDPDLILNEVTERKISSFRVGKRIQV